jgi:hypothetical protein
MVRDIKTSIPAIIIGGQGYAFVTRTWLRPSLSGRTVHY